MIHPRHWLKFALARRALRGYPLYDVPHKQAEGTLEEAAVQQNFDYFMRVRMDRLAYFSNWLKANFKVSASLDGAGLTAVSRWGEAYGGGLIRDEGFDVNKIYAAYQPRWEGAYAGYNVMIDVGIFLGEYLIAKRSRLYWEIYRGHEIEPASFKNLDFLKPCLGGMPNLQKPDPLVIGRGAIANSRGLASTSEMRRFVSTRNSLISGAKYTLFYSNSDAFFDPLNPGDYRNEPI